MCEYCGCQAIAAIDELTREHERVVDLISAARRAHREHDVVRVADVARQIAVVLDPHTEVEEQGLFAALAGAFPEQIAALVDEHRRLAAVLGEAATQTPVDPSWPRRLIDELDMLREHILAEQDGVFPAALAQLSTEEWEAVEAVRTRVGSAVAPSGSPGLPAGQR